MRFGDFLDGFYDITAQLPDYLFKKASVYFALENETKSQINTIEQFEGRKKYIKEYFLDAIGGLEIKRTPLNEVCTGIIDTESYSIKKYIFQSQPGIYVTTNLYIPNGLTEKAPAVLFACGHSEAAKAYPVYQKVCIDLVKNGFIVLSVDPIGQGERVQYYDEGSKRLIIGHCILEHSYIGLQCDLTGSSIIRYFVWDLIRSLDFLCSLPEVDSNRIGMTGSSGGGTQTCYMMMLDDRIKAAVPITFITSREAYMKTGQAHDSEQNIFGAVSEGLNYDDFVTAFAPKPALIGAVESDFFCIEGTVQAYERARKVYELYSRGDRVGLHIAKGVHGFNDELRQAAVNWFLVHLKEEEGGFKTNPSDIITEEISNLWCTSNGNVIREYENTRTIFDLNVDYLRENIYYGTEDPLIIREKIEKVLNMPQSKGKIYPRYISNNKIGGISYTKIFFFSEENIAVDGILIEAPRKKSNVCKLLLLDEGTNEIIKENCLINKFLEQGNVFVFDPRGVGASRSRPVNNHPYCRMYGTEFKLNLDAVMMKTSLMGLRVFDTLKAFDFLKQHYPETKIELAGKGTGALYTLFAGVLRDEIKNIYLENMIPSFESVVNKKYYCYNAILDIYGVLKEFDIPQVLEAFKNKSIIIANTADMGLNAIASYFTTSQWITMT